MAGRDAGNTSRNAVSGPSESATVTRLYDDREQGDEPPVTGPDVPTAATPAVLDDAVYLPGGVVDTSDGTVERTVDYSSEPAATPAVANNHVYRTTATETTAIELDTGNRRWSVNVGHPSLDPVVTGDRVYVASRKNDEGLIALGTGSGNRDWTYPHTLGRITGVAAVGDRVYVTETGDSSSGDGRVTAIDAETGDVRWYEALERILVAPVASSDGVFVGTERGILYSFDETGRLRWQENVVSGNQGFVTSRPALGDQRVFVPSNNGRITVAINRETGEIDWEHRTGMTLGSPAIGKTHLYVGTANDGIQVLEQEGSHRWTVDGPTVSSGLALVDDRLYFVSGTALYVVT